MTYVISMWLSQGAIREASMTTLWLSAGLVVFLAFMITPDAGIRCPLAFLRLVQRVSMAAFAIALAYVGTRIGEGKIAPDGSELILYVTMTLSILPSAIRHGINSTPIPSSNSWRGFHRAIKEKLVYSPQNSA